jgi:hypothetical protein
MQVSRLTTAVLLGCLVTSCGESSLSTTSTEPLAPNFVPGSHTPQTSGPNVLRHEPAAAIVWDGELAVLAGADVDIAEACPDFPPLNAPVKSQLVFAPRSFHANIDGTDVTFQVFEFTGDLTHPCDLATAPLIARGTGSVRWIDNAAGAAVFHIVMEGVVELLEGGEATLFVKAHDTINASHVHSRVTITLTPQ